MAYSVNLIPPIAASNYVLASGAAVFDDVNHIITVEHRARLIAQTAISNLHIKALRVIIKYAIQDTADELYPHDNPLNNALSLRCDMFPGTPTDDDEMQYFYNVYVPFSSSYTTTSTFNSAATQLPYVRTDLNIPIDTRHTTTDSIAFNIRLDRPCRVYALSCIAEYES